MTPAVEAARRAGVAFRLHEYSEAVYGDSDDYAALNQAEARRIARRRGLLMHDELPRVRALPVLAHHEWTRAEGGPRGETGGFHPRQVPHQKLDATTT